ncbi:MAG: Nramp family divalent metal transporter [Cyanobacteria bacterium P01_H01_bin.162]
MLKKLKNLGPGLIVTAAFMGPGTVTTASITGASFGFALLWAIAFSTVATIVLQEMAGRLGLVSRKGLGEALATTFKIPAVRIAAIALMIAAIAFGNAAFETGNIIGTAIGLEAIIGGSTQIWSVLIGIIAFGLLYLGIYKLIEKVLVGLVLIMSVVFLLSAIVARPDLGAVFSGLFIPRIPEGSLVSVIALIGTTVVPYNLFLHSNSVQEKWPDESSVPEAISESRFDTIISIALGGLITMAILCTSAAAFFGAGTTIDSAGAMAEQLEPLLGPAARIFFATGLFAAGITSTITAPLATAYTICGALGWEQNLKTIKFRVIWIITLVVGTVLAASGTRPLQAIVFAQAANGLLLPLVAVFLLFVMNRSDLLGEYKNKTFTNILGFIVVLVAAGLGANQLLKVFGVI